jgi:acetolactate synthase-1/2/3 large subunit
MRATAMTDADTVLVIGRKLDCQVGYGSPAVFPRAKLIRVADTPGELIDNRGVEPEILATPALALDAIVLAAGNRKSAVDKTWTERLRKGHRDRSGKTGLGYTTGTDGGVDPRAIFPALLDKTEPDYIAIADGGALRASRALTSKPPPTWTPARLAASAVKRPTLWLRRSPILADRRRASLATAPLG